MAGKGDTKVMFICRGSTRDGIGHILRSRAVAAGMADRASVLLAAIGGPFLENLLAGRGMDYRTFEDEGPVMDAFREYGPDVVVFDLTSFDEGRFRAVSGKAVTVGLSPIFNCIGGLDALFHRSSVLGEGWTERPGGPVIRSGLRYSVISSHCRAIPEDVYTGNLGHGSLSLAISMGGTDSANKTLRVLETIKRLPQSLLVWVMLGEGYSHSYGELVRCMQGETTKEIILARTNDSMWRILGTCSLAILAGGTTTYEAAYSGLPSINTLETKEHYFLVRELVEGGACLCAGRDFEESMGAINGMIDRLCRDHGELLRMHRRSRALVDGGGVKRIVDEILGMAGDARGGGADG